jgi:hypothetical protein
MASGSVGCPKCGAVSGSSAQLCYNCGEDLAGARAMAAPAGALSAGDRTGARVPSPSSTGHIVAYDAEVIHGFARWMYTQAAVVVTVYIAAGAFFGAAFGVALGTVIRSWQMGAVVGMAAGAAAGYFLGNMRANALRLNAQVALCQVEIEKNTRRS